jgi:hypothetical protein
MIFCGGGQVLALMSAKQTIAMAIRLIGSAVNSIVLTAFTFDLLSIAEAIVDAARRGVQCRVYVDGSHTMSGKTAFQPERVKQMRVAGVEVFVSKGIPCAPEYRAADRSPVSGNGILHAKLLLADNQLIHGSANWTTSSTCNIELSTLTELNPNGVLAFEKWLHHLELLSDPLTESFLAEALTKRERRRAQSSDPNGEHQTARRFSLARGRSLEAARRAEQL